jgi:hypothetical protein
MERFISIQTGIEVLGQAILAVVNSVGSGRETMLNFLRRNGIIDLLPDRWYSLDEYLMAYTELAESMGNSIFYVMGLVTVENLFPESIKSLDKGLQKIDEVYRTNHQGGGIGYYKLVDFDYADRSAIMKCSSPYPVEYNNGIITAVLKKFKPHSTNKCVATIAHNHGAPLSSVDYLITW